jgi:alanine racemase
MNNLAKPNGVNGTATSAHARLVLDAAALAANWADFARAVAPARCGAAIKADGYGLGAPQALRVLARAGVRDFYVAHWAEVPPLLPLPDGVSVAVLHGVTEADMPAALALPARPVLVSEHQAALWRQTGRPADAMIDTGMNRLGLAPATAATALAGISIDVLHSHLACADQPGHLLNTRQREAFAAIAATIPAAARALANSAGVALGRAFHHDLVRPGIGLYGGGLLPDGRPSRAVARLQARIIQLRAVPAGSSVGYGAQFVAARASRIATVALGYADGYARSLSGGGGTAGGWALAGGLRCPAAGRVSMDMAAFDVTGAAPLAEGDWLEIGFVPEDVAAAAARTSYELLTRLGSRLDRVWQ